MTFLPGVSQADDSNPQFHETGLSDERGNIAVAWIIAFQRIVTQANLECSFHKCERLQGRWEIGSDESDCTTGGEFRFTNHGDHGQEINIGAASSQCGAA